MLVSSHVEFVEEPFPSEPNGYQMNMSERYLLSVLKRIKPDEWKYAGDGTLTIGRLKPDYICVNGKRAIIELYGNVWHTIEEAKARIARYKFMGYDCLVIWGEQLIGDEDELVRHILEWEYYEPIGKDVGSRVPKPVNTVELKLRIPSW